MAESEEELKILLMNVKEESKKKKKTGLKFNIQKMKIMASGSITSWQIGGKTVTDIFLGSESLQMFNLDNILKAETLLCQQRSI